MHKFENCLISLRLKWESDPKSCEHEVLEVLDKIIYSQVKKAKNGFYCYDREDYDDVIQDLRLMLWTVWTKKIEPGTTNKRLFNFLKSKVYWAILMRVRETQKKIQRGLKVNHHLMAQPFSYEHPTPVDFEAFANDELDRLIVARCKKGGKEWDIKELGKLTDKQFTNIIEAVEEYQAYCNNS